MSIATELTNLTNNISSAYTTIGNKGGTVPAHKNTDNLANAINSIPTSSAIVNGAITQLKADSSTIDKDTFVEFTNSISRGTDTQLSSASGGYTNAVSEEIGTDKVFVAHSNGGYLYGVVCTISGDTITVGTAVQISTAANSAQYVSITKLDTDKVFLSYRWGSYLYGVVCTVSGTTITAGTETEISHFSNSYYYSSATALSSTKVFVASRTPSVTGFLCSIEGTTITVDTYKSIHSATANDRVAAVTIDSNKVFVCFNHTYCYGVVCTISGNDFSVGTEAQISSGATIGNLMAKKVETGKTIVVFSLSITHQPYAVVCSITNSTFTFGIESPLPSYLSSNTFPYYSIGVLSDKKVFITVGYGYNCLGGVVCHIVGDSAIPGGKIQLYDTNTSSSYESASVAVLDSDRVFVSHRRGNYLWGIVATASDTTVIPATSTATGLTKTQCTTSTAGDIWVLDS